MDETDIRSTTSQDGEVRRRTILAGAAWTIPVVAVATATPAMAASSDLELAFDSPTYTTIGCTVLSNVQVRATENGSPAEGRVVTVTLPAGYQFADGSTSFSGPTDASGMITLPDIVTPATPGTVTLTGSSPGFPPATASVTNEGATQTFAWAISQDGTGEFAYPSVPEGSRPMGGAWYQAPNGDIYFGNERRVIGAEPGAQVYLHPNGVDYAGYIDSSGVARAVDQTGSSDFSYPSVPAGSRPMGGAWYQAPNGDIYFGNERRVVGAEPGAVVYLHENGNDYAGYIDSSGVARAVDQTGSSDFSYPSVPAGSRPMGGAWYQAPNGDIYFGNQRRVVGAEPGAEVYLHPNGTNYAGYADSSGAMRAISQDGTENYVYPGVPAGSRPMGGAWYQAPNGDIYFGNQRRVVGAEPGAVVYLHENGNDYAGYILEEPRSSC